LEKKIMDIYAGFGTLLNQSLKESPEERPSLSLVDAIMGQISYNYGNIKVT
jgi:hypothetical protein